MRTDLLGSLIHAVTVGLLAWECFINLPFDVYLICTKGWLNPRRFLTRFSYLCSRYLALITAVAFLWLVLNPSHYHDHCASNVMALSGVTCLMASMSYYLLLGRTLMMFPSPSRADRFCRQLLWLSFLASVIGIGVTPYSLCQLERSRNDLMMGIQLYSVTQIIFVSVALGCSLCKVTWHMLMSDGQSGSDAGRGYAWAQRGGLASYAARVRGRAGQAAGGANRRQNPLVIYLVLQGVYTLALVELVAVGQTVARVKIEDSMPYKTSAMYAHLKLICALCGVAFRDTYKAARALRETGKSLEGDANNRRRSTSLGQESFAEHTFVRDADDDQDQSGHSASKVADEIKLETRPEDSFNRAEATDGFEANGVDATPSWRSSQDLRGLAKCAVSPIINDDERTVGASSNPFVGEAVAGNELPPPSARSLEPSSPHQRLPYLRGDTVSLAEEAMKQSMDERSNSEVPNPPTEENPSWLRRWVPSPFRSSNPTEDRHCHSEGCPTVPPAKSKRHAIRGSRAGSEGCQPCTDRLSAHTLARARRTKSAEPTASSSAMQLRLDDFDDGQGHNGAFEAGSAGETLARVHILGYQPRTSISHGLRSAPADTSRFPSTAPPQWQLRPLDPAATSLPPPPRRPTRKKAAPEQTHTTP
ncbi:hypothetical protein ACQY0O_005778 [Thecaphora frezii]